MRRTYSENVSEVGSNRMVPVLSTDVSAEQTFETDEVAPATEIREALVDEELFVQVVGRHRMKPGLARAWDKGYRAAVGFAIRIFYEIQFESNRDQLLEALKKASGDTSRTRDALSIILNYLINYGGSEGRQYRSRDKQVAALMIELEKLPEEVPAFIKDTGGFRECVKMYRDRKKPKVSEEEGNRSEEYPRALSALVHDTLLNTGDRALSLNRLARYSGKRVDIEKSIKIPQLSDEDLEDFWKQIRCVVEAFARGERVRAN